MSSWTPPLHHPDQLPRTKTDIVSALHPQLTMTKFSASRDPNGKYFERRAGKKFCVPSLRGMAIGAAGVQQSEASAHVERDEDMLLQLLNGRYTR